MTTERSYKQWAAFNGWDPDIDDLKPRIWMAWHCVVMRRDLPAQRAHFIRLAASCILDEEIPKDEWHPLMYELEKWPEMTQGQFVEKLRAAGYATS